jgi:hypothetical protein
MGRIVDALVETVWRYSAHEAGAMHYLPERKLGYLTKAAHLSKEPRQVTLPGKKKARETGYFFMNAYALGQYAQQVEEERNCQTMAVLFRDTDGTRSSEASLWTLKANSIQMGFLRAGYTRGVPMVPKPKSEAWLLCALQPQSYHNCAALEVISGNDNSPNDAKSALAQALEKRQISVADLAGKVKDGSIDPLRTQMPSFEAFRNRLQEAAAATMSS